MPGRAPLERRVVGPLDRHQVVDADLRLLVLHEVLRHAGRQLRVARAAPPASPRAWRRSPSARAAARRRGARAARAPGGRSRRGSVRPSFASSSDFALGQSHARAEAAVEPHDDRVLQRLVLRVAVVGQLLERRQIGRPARSNPQASGRSRPPRAAGSSARTRGSRARRRPRRASSRRWRAALRRSSGGDASTPSDFESGPRPRPPRPRRAPGRPAPRPT